MFLAYRLFVCLGISRLQRLVQKVELTYTVNWNCASSSNYLDKMHPYTESNIETDRSKMVFCQNKTICAQTSGISVLISISAPCTQDNIMLMQYRGLVVKDNMTSTDTDLDYPALNTSRLRKMVPISKRIEVSQYSLILEWTSFSPVKEQFYVIWHIDQGHLTDTISFSHAMVTHSKSR